MKYAILNALLFFCSSLFAQSPDDWKISDRTARRMISYLSECTVCPSSRATPDTAKELAIRAAYPFAKSFSWVKARYRADDVDRYASRFFKTSSDPSVLVAGFSTQLLKVVTETDDTIYFDIVSICPPPAGCNVVGEEGQ